MTLLMSLNSMNSTSALRMEKLKQDDYQTWLVVDWLQKEGHERFQNPVFLPPLLSLGIKDKSLATLAEGCLRPNDLTVPSNEKGIWCRYLHVPAGKTMNSLAIWSLIIKRKFSREGWVFVSLRILVANNTVNGQVLVPEKNSNLLDLISGLQIFLRVQMKSSIRYVIWILFIHWYVLIVFTNVGYCSTSVLPRAMSWGRETSKWKWQTCHWEIYCGKYSVWHEDVKLRQQEYQCQHQQSME